MGQSQSKNTGLAMTTSGKNDPVLNQPLRIIPADGTAAVHILCFHGGGGVAGTPEMIEPFCDLLRDGTGITVSLARYRTLETAPSVQLEEMLADACSALLQARKVAHSQGARLYVLGASFGALLALHAVTENSDEVRGLIILNPVTDIDKGGFSNRVVDPSRHAPLSPHTRYANHALLSRLRCFIAHGDGDEVIPIAASRRFAALWPEGRCELTEYPGATHGFFNRSPNDRRLAGQVVDFVTGCDPRQTQTQTQKRQLPDHATLLFGLGSLHSETGWLHAYLQSHPDCHTPDMKEVHYFDVVGGNLDAAIPAKRIQTLRRVANNLDDENGPENLGKLRQITRLARHLEIYTAQPGDHRLYLNYLLDTYSQQKILCDITPSYYMLPVHTFTEMDSLTQSKYIFLMPDPVKRMWSQIQMTHSALTQAASHTEMLAGCEQRARELCRGGQMAHLQTADYARTVRRLESVVPQSRILYLFRHPDADQQMQDEICTFLGIRSHPAQSGGTDAQEQSGVPLSAEIKALMLEALRPQYDFALERFGAEALQDWRMPPARQPHRSRPRSALKNPTIAFLHIPKTAGQTVVSEIRRVVGEAASSPVRTHTEAAEDAQFPSGYSFYGGHLDWVDLETLPENRFSFTILRDPRERIASFYFYLLREAQALSKKELQTPQRTGMRMILQHSAEQYFFGGDQAWQSFIHDHYDNFYCNYVATRKIRGWKEIKHLSENELVERALEGAHALDGIYSVSDLGRLEEDLEPLLETSLNLVGNYKNSGPAARQKTRWNALVKLFDNPENVAKLEQFVHTDEILMKRLGIEV